MIDTSVSTLEKIPTEHVTVKMVLPSGAAKRPRLPIWLDDDSEEGVKATHFGVPPPFQVDCLFSSDIIVSGHGLLWLGQSVIVDRSVMPKYWHDRLTGHPLSSAEKDADLPVRVIDEPCISALGWGATTVYGHLLIEMVPRILVALKSVEGSSPRVLLRSDAPGWQKKILRELGVQEEQFITFDADVERVRLAQGIFPTYAYRNSFHPGVPDLIDAALPSIEYNPQRSGIVYASRLGQINSGRQCLNEKDLIEVARGEFGVRIIEPEKLPWLEQIKIFREAKAVVGLYGSGLHTSLFCGAGLNMGVIGIINNAQAHIAGVRDQRMAYLLKDVNPFGPFIIKNGPFRALLQSMISAA